MGIGRRSGAQAALLAILLATGGAAAEPDGALLALACTGCHAPDAQGSIPQIWGRDASEIAALLTAFAAGEREGTVMPRLMRDYTPEEIAALGAYVAEAPR
jgi:cytochrome c553